MIDGVLITLWMCLLQIDHLKKMIFINKKLPNDLKVGCSKPFNLVGASKIKLKLLEDFDAKFEEGVIQEKLLNIYDFPFLFPFCHFHMFLFLHEPEVGTYMDFLIF